MAEETENINNEGEESEKSTDPEVTEETEDKTTDTKEEESEESKEDEKEDSEEDSDEDDYKAKTKKRFDDLTGQLGETKTTNEELVKKVGLLTETIEKLTASETTTEERNEVLEKIKELDEKGLDTYEELAKLVAELAKSEIKKETDQATKAKQEEHKANIKQMQTDLQELQDLSLLKKEEMSEFVNWCADKLDETKSEKFPEGNVKIYGDFHRAITHYREHQKATKKPDEKARLDRSGSPPSSSTTDAPAAKVSLEDLKNMTMAEAIKRSR